MRSVKKICILVLMLILLLTFSGCILKKVINLFSGIKVNEYSTQEYIGPPDGHDELVWDEKAMFGLKFPGGEIYSHHVILGRHSYEIHGLSYDQFKACIEEIKDLGFTQKVEENEYRYKGYHEKYNNRFIWIEYIHTEGTNIFDHVDIHAGHD